MWYLAILGEDLATCAFWNMALVTNPTVPRQISKLAVSCSFRLAPKWWIIPLVYVMVVMVGVLNFLILCLIHEMSWIKNIHGLLVWVAIKVRKLIGTSQVFINHKTFLCNVVCLPITLSSLIITRRMQCIVGWACMRVHYSTIPFPLAYISHNNSFIPRSSPPDRQITPGEETMYISNAHVCEAI